MRLSKVLNRNQPSSRSRQAGFSLFETVTAVALVGVAIVGIIGGVSSASRSSSRETENVRLLQLARAQAEEIQNSPYKSNPAEYPAFAPIPAGYTVSWTSTDPGPSYAYAAPSTTTIVGSVQQIVVFAAGDNATTTLTFYKVRAP